MAVALYRRYRPETFADLIGQEQVTGPLSAAIRNGRINHAYLFSGPRGCGKTTSARILARCLNCHEGPTPEPCGVCPSCVELSRDGSGSLDVVEIDAASHNGVDDARDLRERAIFAPARDRYKIFILDEAHMVTAQGFNALLKIVEEPPEHIKFIFATTEPDKVIGTIRSRTHHYPFRLIPQGPMLEYVTKLLQQEGITADEGVLGLAIKAGGGSARDTLSIVDQLIAGSENEHIEYDRAVALLGYTHQGLLDDLMHSLAESDTEKSFEVVEEAINNGQDPRRFVEDVLERLRDLIIVSAGGMKESALPGLSDLQTEALLSQVQLLGKARLSALADIVLASLDQLSGATSPKIQLELMLARMLVSLDAGQETQHGSPSPQTQQSAEKTSPAPAAPSDPVPAASPIPARAHSVTESSAPESSMPSRQASNPAPAPAQAHQASEPVGPLTYENLSRQWPNILQKIQSTKISAWMLISHAEPVKLEDNILTMGFRSEQDYLAFRQVGADTPSGILRTVIRDLFGVEVKYQAVPLASVQQRTKPAQTAPAAQQPEAPTPHLETLPRDEVEAEAPDEFVAETAPPVFSTQAQASEARNEPAPEPIQNAPQTSNDTPATRISGTQIDTDRFGDPIIRQILGGRPIAQDKE